MKLHPSFVLPLLPAETPTSYASRIAARIGRNLRSLLHDLGIAFQGLVDGKEASVGALAAATGVDSRAFDMQTIRRIEPMNFSVGAEALVRDAVNRTATMVCPQCIEEDLAGPYGRHGRYGRWFWELTAYRCCLSHRCLLQPLGGGGGVQRLHDFAWHVDANLPALLNAPKQVVGSDAGAIPRYVVDRVEGTAPASWLMSMPFYAAVKTMEMVGITINAGVGANWRNFAAMDWLKAGAAGHRELSQGPDRLGMFLHHLRHMAAPEEFGLRKVYGSFYDFLDRTTDPAYEVVANLMREHILETTSVAGGEVVLGKVQQVRRVHSVRSASVEFGLHPKTLRKQLADLGILDSSVAALPHDRALFDAPTHVPLLAKLAEAMPKAEAQRYLGLPRSLSFLIDRPYVEPVTHGEFGCLENMYTRTDIEALARHLTANASAVSPTEGGLVTLSQAVSRVQQPMSAIVKLLLERKLATLRWNGRMDGVGRLLVDPQEVKDLLVPATDVLTITQAKEVLGCSREVVVGLLAVKALPWLTERSALNHLETKVIPRAAVDKFDAEFGSVHKLARQLGRHGKWLKSRLSKLAVEPDFDPDIVGTDFHRRSKVEPLLSCL